MCPAKGARVPINYSTLGDIAAEEPPMKLSLIARKAYVGRGKRGNVLRVKPTPYNPKGAGPQWPGPKDFSYLDTLQL